MKVIVSFLWICTFLLCQSAVSQIVPDSMNEGSYFYPRPVLFPSAIYWKPTNVITRDSEKEAVPPIRFNFITDFPHSGLPANNYIKPGSLVATMSISSKPLHYNTQNIEPNSGGIFYKKNILYKEIPVSNKKQQLV